MTEQTSAGTTPTPATTAAGREYVTRLSGGTIPWPEGGEPLFHHVVTFTMHAAPDGGLISDADIDDALTRMGTMCDQPMVVVWEVAVSADRRKGVVLIEDMFFLSEEDFDAFKASAGHQDWVVFIRDRADWIVVDYYTTA